MPTIAFISPKGGVGKTTSAFLFATTLAKIYDVTMIDADPNHPIQTWAADAEPAASRATNRGSIFTAEPPWLVASRDGGCCPFRLAN